MRGKIAFITFGHWASTIALAKHLTDSKCDVDIYIECFRKRLNNVEATDIQQENLRGIIGKVEKSDSVVMRDYCPLVVFYYLRLISPMVYHAFLSKISNYVNSLIIKYICGKLNKKKYDCVILVGRYQADHLIYYHKNLNCKVYTCLHEVCDHQNPDYENVTPLLKYLFQKEKHIVVHSNNCKDFLLKYKQSEKRNIKKINLGLSETWNYIQTLEGKSILPDKFRNNYVLLIGGIDKYKGLDTLLKTIEILNAKKKEEIKYVIAGNGSDSCLRKLSTFSNVYIINRFLSNTEFAYLVRNCRCTICPYHSMSQSGVPLASYTLGKPLIASRLDGFEEYVEDKKDGFLCNKDNFYEFADAICKVYAEDVYSFLCSNVICYEKKHNALSWDAIVKAYFELIYD